MGRKKGFNSEKALEKATLTFWRIGYKKASIQKLMKEMGLGESSFYNSFKNKEELYLKCLKHYNENITYVRVKALNSSLSIKQALKNFFEIIFSELSSRKKPQGCLMTNSLSSEVLDSNDLRKYVLDEMRGFTCLLESKLEKAVESGELPKSIKPSVVSKIIVTYIQGLFKISMITPDLDELKNQTDKFLASILS